jgi:CBS domain-containing protein
MSSSQLETLEAFALAAERAMHDGKVLAGKDGWLFLANDTNQVLKQHAGELRFSDFELNQWQLVLEQRLAWVRMLGGSYFFVVPPNPQSVYPEKLPDLIATAPERPVMQLARQLERSGSPAGVVYPLDELVAAKAEWIYPKSDTHWTAIGAFIGYERLLDEVEQVAEVRRVTREELRFEESQEIGDLGGKLRPPLRHRHLRPTFRSGASARLVLDNCVGGNGTLLVMECAEAPPSTCVVFGDSYSYMLLHYLSESFRRLVFAHCPTLDFDLVRSEKPDVVVNVMNERFLMKIPYDLPAPSLRELADVKRSRKSLRPPIVRFWDFRDERLSVSLEDLSQKAGKDGGTVAQAIVRDTHGIGEELTVAEASRVLLELGAFALPLVDAKGRVTGMLTRNHLLQALAGMEHPDARKAKDVARRGDLALQWQDSLQRAIVVMRESGLTQLPVVKDGVLVGSISRVSIDSYYVRQALTEREG